MKKPENRRGDKSALSRNEEIIPVKRSRSDHARAEEENTRRTTVVLVQRIFKEIQPGLAETSERAYFPAGALVTPALVRGESRD